MKTQVSGLKIFFILFIFISAPFCSCEIYDDHETCSFISREQFPESNYGDFIADTYILSPDILFDTQRKELYYLSTDENSHNNLEIKSLNYETSEIKILLDHQFVESQIEFIGYNQILENLYYHNYGFNFNDHKIVELNVKTGIKRTILNNIEIFEGLVFLNDNQILFNSNYDSLFVNRLDLNGNVKKLDINGEIRLTVENSNEIVIFNYFDTDRIILFDYELDSIIFEIEVNKYPWKLHNSDQGVILFYDSNNSYKFLTSGSTFYQTSAYGDLYPNCNKIAFREVISKNIFDRQSFNFQLAIKDLISGEIQIPVSIQYHTNSIPIENTSETGHIYFAELLDDCKTIIHYTEGSFYKASID